MIKPKSDLCKAFIYHDVEKEELEVRATAKEIVVYFRERAKFSVYPRSIRDSNFDFKHRPHQKTAKNVERKAANLLAQK